MSQQAKPAGIVLVALWSGLFGLACVPLGCAAFLAGIPGAAALSVFGLLVMAMGALLLACAYALWTLQPWGRLFAWWVYLASIPLGLAAIFAVFPGQQMSAGNAALLLGVAIDLMILVHLSDEEVIELFDAGAGHGPLPVYLRREPQ